MEKENSFNSEEINELQKKSFLELEKITENQGIISFRKLYLTEKESIIPTIFK
jgi:hypothetical protein